MGRNSKYPEAEKTIQSFYVAVSESYNSPAKGEAVEGHKKQEIVAEEFNISRLKVRKILITTGELVYPQTAEIQRLLATGRKIPEITAIMGMAASTVNSFLPYSKGVYKLAEVSAAAERTALYRERKQAVEALKEDTEKQFLLWKAICLFQGYPFTTSGRGKREGVKFTYAVSDPGGAGGQKYPGESVEGYGNELFINGREKGISRSSIDYALKIALEESVTGPKQLKIYGASYVYAIFRRFGLI